MSATRRALVLLVWLAALAGALSVAMRASYTADLSAFLPAAPDAQQRALIQQLQSGAASRTLLVAIEGGSAAARAQASIALASSLRAGPLFEQVANGDDAGNAAMAEWVFGHRYLLSPAVTPQRYTEAGLREALDDTLSLLGTPAGARIKPLLARDPTGEAMRIAEAALGDLADGGPRRSGGVWTSRDGARALLVALVRADGADLDAQQAAIAAVRRAHDAQPGRPRELQLHIGGAPTYAVASRAQIEAEVRWLSITGTVLMGVLLVLAFGSLPALAVAALPVASGVLAGIAAVALGFGAVHGLTLGFGTTLIGEGVDYAIYYLIQARSGGWRAWLRSGWPTVRLGLLTSLCGFAALVFSGFPGLAQLGLFSLAGLLGAAATTRWVLPVLRPEGAAGSGLRPQLAAAALGLLRAMPRWRVALTALGLGAVALIGAHRQGLWGAELASLSPVQPELLARDAAFRQDLGRGDALTLVVVPAADDEAALAAAEALGARMDRLVADGRIAGYDSPARLLPSRATQRARLDALPDAGTLQAALARATAGGPLPAARLQAFVDDVQAARRMAPLAPAELRTSPLGPLLAGLLVASPEGGVSALLPVHASPGGVVDAQAIRTALDGVPGARWVEVGPELSRLYRHYLREAQLQAALGAAAVLVLLALALRSARRLAAAALPLLGAVAITAAAFAALGVPLSVLHLVGLLLVVAVGSNYVLFFDGLHRGEAPDADTLASLLLANVTTVLSFGLLAASSIPALSSIGRVVAPGALLALLIGAAWVPPLARQATSPRGG